MNKLQTVAVIALTSIASLAIAPTDGSRARHSNASAARYSG